MMVENNHLVLGAASRLAMIQAAQGDRQALIIRVIAETGCLLIDQEAIDTMVSVDPVAIVGQGGHASLPFPEVTHLVNKGVGKPHRPDLGKHRTVGYTLRIPEHSPGWSCVVNSVNKMTGQIHTVPVEFIREVRENVIRECSPQDRGTSILGKEGQSGIEGGAIEPRLLRIRVNSSPLKGTGQGW